MKKLITIALAACLVISACFITSCSNTDKDTFVVGICQLVPHPALDSATEGFKKALVDALGDKVTFDYQNANNDSTTCTTIMSSFVSKNVDLIMANATPALQAAANATEKIPVLGTSITEYGVALGIDNFSGVVGSNISGTSDLAPLTEQGDIILDLFPDAKNIGLLYCSAEPNSAYQIKVIKEYLEGKGLTCTLFSFSDSNDVSMVTEAAASASDVIYIPTDNTAATCAETIGNIVTGKKVPVIAGEEGLCASCGIATLTISYYDLGYKTGEMAAKILLGTAKIEEMEIAYAPAAKKYNAELAAEYGITIPEGFEKIGG